MVAPNFNYRRPSDPITPLRVLATCDLLAIRRRFGSQEVVKLFQPGGEGPDDYSLKSFVRTNSLFVHLPKTAGVSISRALYGSLAMGHHTIESFRSFFRPRAFARMFKFTFVRNPYDRVHSAYHYLRAGGMGGLDLEFDQRVLSRFPSFEHFVHDGLREEEVRNWCHFIPQTEFLGCRADDHSEDCACGELDFVGRFENLEADFEYVKAQVNPLAQLQHHNRTRGSQGDYRRSYTPEMVDLVADAYAPALDLLGYEFDGAERPMKLAAKRQASASPDGAHASGLVAS